MSTQSASHVANIAFGSIFLAVAIFVGAFITYPELKLGHDAESWSTTEGELIEVRVITHHGDDSTTYSLEGSYRYTWQGKTYQGDQIGIYTGSDNVGSWHTDTRDRLYAEAREHGHVTVFVDPADPSRALLDRTIRWSLAMFELVFMVMFGGAGLSIMGMGFGEFRKRVLPEGPREVSDGSWVRLVFGLLSTIVPLVVAMIVVPPALEEGNLWPLLIFLFPTFGIPMLGSGIYDILARSRWGHVQLHLDSDAEIGGELVGHVELARTLPAEAQMEITWQQQTRRVRTDSDGDTHTTFETTWKVLGLGTVERRPAPARVAFAFPVPHEARPTEPGDGGGRWLLELRAEVTGLDFSRTFEVPVHDSGLMPERRIDPENYSNADEEFTPDPRHAVVRESGLDLWLDFPASRRRGMAFALCIFGAVFVATGLALEFLTDEMMATFMGVIFTFAGALTMALGAWWLGASSHVHLSMNGLEVTRRWMGLAVSTDTATLTELDALDMSTDATVGSDGETTVYWTLVADTHDEPITLATSVPDVQQATWILRHVEAHLAGLGHAVPMRTVNDSA